MNPHAGVIGFVVGRQGDLVELALAEGDAARAVPLDAAAEALSPRELDVLRLVAFGRSNAEIASERALSVRTVERHLANLYAKRARRSGPSP